MIRHLTTALLLGIATAAQAAEAPAAAAGPDLPPTHHWELDVFGGYGQLAWPGLDSASTRWSNGGPAFALSAAYRGPHFTHPFLDLAYVPFVASGQDVSLPDTGGTTYTTASTHAIAVSVGPGFDISWFRVRAGVGAYWLTTSTSVEGVSSSATSVHLGYLLSAAALVWERGPFAVGAELRFFALHAAGQGVYQSSWAAGLTGRWDFSNH